MAGDPLTDTRGVPGRVFAGLWTAAWQERGRTLTALALMVLAKVSAVGVPLLLKAIVDGFSEPRRLADAGPPGGPPLVLVLPVFLLLGYALLRFAGTLFTEVRDLVFARVTRRTVASYAERAFWHLMSLSPRFHAQRQTGGLIRAVERGTNGIGFLLGAGLFTVVPTLVEFAAVLVVMAAGYSLWFTLAIMVTFFVYASYTLLLTGQRALQQRRLNELDSRANGRLVDTLLNYESVKTHAREAYERQRYADMLTQWTESGVANQRALSRLHIGQSAIIAAGVAAVMLLAGQQTVRGAMTVGDLVLVNAYLLQICLPLNALGFVFREARDALVSTEQLFRLLEEPAEIEDRPGSAPLGVRGGAVSFEKVSFAYEPGRQILFDLDLAIGPGQTVAVVGGSGSGKSTLARLLMRLYDVHGGRITVDGQDLRAVTLASLRQAIGIVPQDTTLFNDTIAHNIAYGRAGAGLAEVIEAARAAQVHEFIQSLPEQYDTVVGERGMKLSGGERQRIAIARAFLKNPPIMIFDEATSALDTRAERAIQGELDRIAEGRTTLIIAHRLSTIVNADEIVVLDKGRIVERGRHEALLERAGLYAQLWNLQRQQQQFERLERELARQPVNLAVLMAQTVEGLRPAIEARRVRVDSSIDLENASVTGDPSTLAQVLQQLCVAAVEATAVGGTVELRLERSEARARVTVAAGRASEPPAPTATLERRPRGTETPLDPLALRSTIERQGGSFAIEPPSFQRGLRYAVELPLRALVVRPAAPAAGERPGPGAVTLPPRALAGLRVLEVDDQADAREAIERLLEAEGALVMSFGSGSAALEWLQRQPATQWPDLMLCDIALGAEDGHAVMRRVRELEAARGVASARRMPAVALTGLARADERLRALQAGFQVQLAKPVDAQELVSTLAMLAGRAGGPPGAPVIAPLAPEPLDR